MKRAVSSRHPYRHPFRHAFRVAVPARHGPHGSLHARWSWPDLVLWWPLAAPV
jgi:hypothetical protein